MIKNSILLLAFVFWTNFSIADGQKILSQKNCSEIKGSVLYLRTVADENWKALETNPREYQISLYKLQRFSGQWMWLQILQLFTKYFVIRNKDDKLSSKSCSFYPKKGTQ